MRVGRAVRQGRSQTESSSSRVLPKSSFVGSTLYRSKRICAPERSSAWGRRHWLRAIHLVEAVGVQDTASCVLVILIMVMGADYLSSSFAPEFLPLTVLGMPLRTINLPALHWSHNQRVDLWGFVGLIVGLAIGAAFCRLRRRFPGAVAWGTSRLRTGHKGSVANPNRACTRWENGLTQAPWPA
jgi:hypothetical protein